MMLRSGVRVLRRSDSEGAKDYCSASPAAEPSRLTRVFLSLQAHLAERLARGANWTVFAPNDVAFAATLEALGLSASNEVSVLPLEAQHLRSAERTPPLAI